jgi:hypothetical protein
VAIATENLTTRGAFQCFAPLCVGHGVVGNRRNLVRNAQLIKLLQQPANVEE